MKLFLHSGAETVLQLQIRHSVQAKRDTESSIISKFWIPPACAGLGAGVKSRACGTGMTTKGEIHYNGV